MTLQEYREIALNGHKEQAIEMAMRDGIVLTSKTANFIGNSTEGVRFIQFIRGRLIRTNDEYEVKDKWYRTEAGANIKRYWIAKKEQK